jgi:hypothetical protein
MNMVADSTIMESECDYCCFSAIRQLKINRVSASAKFLLWRTRPCKQFGEVVIHAGDPEVRLPLERLTQVASAVRVFAGDFNAGEDGGSSTICAKITARAAASGCRAHQMQRGGVAMADRFFPRAGERMA